MPAWLMLDRNPATQKLAAASDRSLYQLHYDGKVWRYTGQPVSGWELIDQNPATVDIVAAPGVLYQRHRDGKIWRYTCPPLRGWELIDRNPATVQIAASAGGLYQRHMDGRIWRYTGTPLTGWELIDQNPQTVQIAATRDTLYQRHRDGKIWRYTGKPLTGWELIGEDVNIRSIVTSHDGAVYQLRTDGRILRYAGPSGGRWTLLDRNPATVGIAAADGGGLYQRHRDGAVWRFTGTPLTGWELMDRNQATVDIVAAAAGTVYQRRRDGKVWRSGVVDDVTYSLVVTSVRCVDETEHEGFAFVQGEGLANDAMRLKALSTWQKEGQAVEQGQTAVLDLGSNYQDGTVVPMNLEVAKVRLAAADRLPMSVTVGFVLLEEDWFGDAAGIETAVRGYADATRTVHGTLSAILAKVPGVGFQIGSIIGGVASELEPAIANAVLAAANDVFPLTDVSIVIPDRNAPFAPGAETGTLRFVAHGGEYEISYAWRMQEKVPPPPCDGPI
jgi:hypothetical protein